MSGLFEDAVPILEWLQQQGRRVGIVSNWQRGLSHFCRELGILSYLDFVLVSAEVGCEKPAPRIFGLAARRMHLPPGEILRVGDHAVEDAKGALETGMRAALLVREGVARIPGVTSVRSLREIRTLPNMDD